MASHPASSFTLLSLAWLSKPPIEQLLLFPAIPAMYFLCEAILDSCALGVIMCVSAVEWAGRIGYNKGELFS